MLRRIRKKIEHTIFYGDNKLSLTNIRYLPRWVVLFIDSFLVLTSIVFVHFILFSMNVPDLPTLTVVQEIFLITAINLFFFYFYRTYSGIVRHSSFTDLLKILMATTSTTAILILLNLTHAFVRDDKVFYYSEIVLFSLISFAFLLFFRLIVKQTYQFLKSKKVDLMRKRVVILGTDDNAVAIANTLSRENTKPFEVVGFMTNQKSLKGIRLMDRPVILYENSICEGLCEYDVEGVLITADDLSMKEKNKLVDDCMEKGIQLFNVPKVEAWSDQAELSQQVKAIQIEDLLNRKVIDLDDELIRSDLQGKSVLITGGAGSIGSELVRQIAGFNPRLLVILDQGETAMHNLELELKESHPDLYFVTELANISNSFRLTMLFEEYDFDLVYHAAAYKHVPMIERNPHEAIYVNIMGTMNLAKLAVKYRVSKFVMVSTDKAVNPTNVMGASKRAAEIYVQSLQKESKVKTKFITTRFGNVLGSNGSVIPHFKAQIAKGGPVTVTHPDIIRYFMTIPEACQLVLQAGTMGKGGEVYVFDMGKPVRIMDLAERMIRLSGFVPHKDIEIEVTGLRPGEKLYEELLADRTTHLPTHHKKIMIAADKPLPMEAIKSKYRNIIKAALREEDNVVVKLLKEIVPEFKSKNSKFSALDRQPKPSSRKQLQEEGKQE